jgi:hypothetical protein
MTGRRSVSQFRGVGELLILIGIQAPRALPALPPKPSKAVGKPSKRTKRSASGGAFGRRQGSTARSRADALYLPTASYCARRTAVSLRPPGALQQSLEIANADTGKGVRRFRCRIGQDLQEAPHSSPGSRLLG